jgi:putative ABC transport system permease protein
MKGTLHDFVAAIKSLIRDPSFTCIATLNLTLGIGGAVAIFSVIYAVLLDPFPYRDIERIVGFQIRNTSGDASRGRSAFRPDEFADYQAALLSFEAVIAGTREDVLYTTAEGTEQLFGGLVSGNLFEFLGVPAKLGRTLLPADAEPQAPRTFVMSHRLWIRLFGGDPHILGRQFLLNGAQTELVGIMPARFTKLGVDVWRPTQINRTDPDSAQRSFTFEGRLKRGTTIEETEAEIAVVAKRVATTYPSRYPDSFSVIVTPFLQTAVAQFRQTLYGLAIAVGILVVVACANVANLLLTRASTRSREVAIRSALGATRRVLIRQLLGESLVLALLSGVFGITVAYLGLASLVRVMPQGLIPGEAVIEINFVVLCFGVAFAIATAVTCGFVTVVGASRKDLTKPLRAAATGMSESAEHQRWNNTLVVVEVGLATTLILGAGLLARSLVNLQTVDLGLDTGRVLHARLSLPRTRYSTAENTQQFYDELLSRLKLLPGVVSAATTSALPPYGGDRSELDVLGTAHVERWEALFQLCSEGYFRTLGVPMLSGRALTITDTSNSRRVAVVNEAFANRYLAAVNPLGRQVEVKLLSSGANPPVQTPVFEIVGVAANSRNQGVLEPALPEIFIPFSTTGAFPRGILIKTESDPLRMINGVRREVWAMDRNVALTLVGSLDDYLVRFSYAQPRFMLSVFTVFSCTSLLLVVLGVFGVISYRVARQKREIAIRMSLGASRTEVVRMILDRGMRLVAAGQIVGLVGSLALTRVIASQLFGVSAYDPATLLAGTSAIALGGFIACYLPAIRAARGSPWHVLRND